MATILFYTSPARGHLFPILDGALELKSRGHNIHINTLSTEIERVQNLGLDSESISDKVEGRELDDWKATNPIGALKLAMKTFADRSVHEVTDLQKAIKKTKPDILVIDTNSWGAQAVAEVSGLPWAVFQPYFTFYPANGVPPFGPGLPRMNGLVGSLRDKIAGKLLFSQMNKLALPAINSVRSKLGLSDLGSIIQLAERPDQFLYFTVEEFDYPREKWPENFKFVGPGLWSPESISPEWLRKIKLPLVLVTCSTERQSDRSIIETALSTIPKSGYHLVATSAAYNPAELNINGQSNVHLERFIPHDPVVSNAEVVICHGGMGITQRALYHGVPLVVIPFGRDQHEVARRVEYCGVGVRLLPNKLNQTTLTDAVKIASKMKNNAAKMAKTIASAGRGQQAANSIEQML